MAGSNWPASSAVGLFQALSEAPHRFDFYQTLRLLECMHPERPRLGCAARPAEDCVRLGQDPTLAFAPSTLSSCRPSADGIPPRLSVYFFGLFGPNAPLPLHLTDYARWRVESERDSTLVHFADMFHHRLLTLFYRVWANSRATVSFDRPDEDPMGRFTASLCGLGDESLRGRDAMPDLVKLHFAGRLAGHTRHPEGLVAILREFFQLPVTLSEFVGRWIRIPVENRCRLGSGEESSRLGLGTIIGERIWDAQQAFRLCVGPLGLEDFLRFLPCTERLRRLVAVVRNYVGDELHWELNPILRKEEVPPLQLGGGARLGWTSWLGDGTPERDAADLLLDPMSRCVHAR